MANWSAIGALGEAAKASGDYFGVLAVEKTRTQRLAEARAEQLADAATARKEKLFDIDNARDYQEGLSEAERLQGIEDDTAAELRRAGIAAGTVGAANREHDRRQGNKPPTIVTAIDPIIDQNGTRHYMWSDGEYRPETSEGGQGVIYEGSDEAERIAASASQAQEGGDWFPGMKEGELTPELVADTRPVFKKPVDDEDSLANMSEQEKSYYRAEQTLKNSIADLTLVLNSGFDPSSLGGAVEVWMSGDGPMNDVPEGIGGPSSAAQVYKRSTMDISESLLRLATGAAAPDTEVSRYAQLFTPGFGDTDAMKASKLNAINQSVRVLEQLRGERDAGDLLQDPSYRDSMIRAFEQAAVANGLELDGTVPVDLGRVSSEEEDLVGRWGQ